jgi:uncharacterized protein YfiM (DUF2279 family)
MNGFYKFSSTNAGIYAVSFYDILSCIKYLKRKTTCLHFFTLMMTGSLNAQVISSPVTAYDSITVKQTDHIPFAKYILSKPVSTNPLYPYSKKKIRQVALANVVVYSAAMTGLYAAWYKDYPKTNFHFFNDNAEWLQIDKIGHAYSAYAESKASMEVWRWTGISRTKRILYGGLSGAAYQTIIETLDGFSSQWGWSWGDFSANIAGSGLLIAQEFAWDEQRIQFKFSFHRKKYADESLIQRSSKIFGISDPERFLKDYNGQTYWLSSTLKSFFKNSNLPPWLQVSVGTGAEGLFGARSNFSRDKFGNVDFNRPDIKRYRQWYLAPDIDLSKIKTKKKGIKMALNILNIFKFPAPSLEYSRNGFKVNFIHF